MVEATVTDVDLRAAIDQLLVLKRAAGELGLGPAIPEIDAFLMSEIARLADVARTLPSKDTSDNTGMDVLLRKTILGQ